MHRTTTVADDPSTTTVDPRRLRGPQEARRDLEHLRNVHDYKMGTTTVAKYPCNGIVKFDYCRVNNYFHYRRRRERLLPSTNLIRSDNARFERYNHRDDHPWTECMCVNEMNPRLHHV